MPRKKGEQFPCEGGRAPGTASFQRFPRKSKLSPERIEELRRKVVPERIVNLVDKYNEERDSFMRDMRIDAIKEWCEANKDSVRFVEENGQVRIDVLRLPPTRR